MNSLHSCRVSWRKTFLLLKSAYEWNWLYSFLCWKCVKRTFGCGGDGISSLWWYKQIIRKFVQRFTLSLHFAVIILQETSICANHASVSWIQKENFYLQSYNSNENWQQLKDKRNVSSFNVLWERQSCVKKQPSATRRNTQIQLLIGFYYCSLTKSIEHHFFTEFSQKIQLREETAHLIYYDNIFIIYSHPKDILEEIWFLTRKCYFFLHFNWMLLLL